MRKQVDLQHLESFMKVLGSVAKRPTRVYLVGGATAVLLNWRKSTIDIDLKFVPESDELFRAIPQLKEQLQINVELASPDHFIPPLPGWQERSSFIAKHGLVDFFHYDFYSQALAKIERGHKTDHADIQAMIVGGLIESKRLLQLFDEIEPELYRYPAVDPASFRKAVEDFVSSSQR